MLVARTIDIAATPERVWSSLINLRRRALLNPAVRVIELETEDGVEGVPPVDGNLTA